MNAYGFDGFYSYFCEPDQPTRQELWEECQEWIREHEDKQTETNEK